MDYGIANRKGQMSYDVASSILDLAKKKGINTLDTAKIYGNSEEVIGQYLELHPDSSWEIITKISNHKKNISIQVLDSYEKLNIYPSVILSHSAELFLDNKFQEEIAEAKDKQLLNKVGVSLYTEAEILSVMVSNNKPEVIQLPLNILDKRLYQSGILAHIHASGIEVHVRSAFLQGLFYISESALSDYFSDAFLSITKLKIIASEAQITLAELSLLWLVSLDEVSQIIIGVDDVDQLSSNLATLNKDIEHSVFKEAMSVIYENESILNPSLWPSKF
jgi:aryl-alcohol dehydrogenase-like predicted oxidoreductase